MTSRQRAYLKSLASKENAIFQVGKASVTPDLTKGISQALKARELVKISVLKNCMDDPKEKISGYPNNWEKNCLL